MASHRHRSKHAARIWKGAISFGLVHVPVALYPASQEDGIDFDWLDRRSMDPVGYKRINKRTGKEIDKDDIVKGVKQDNGKYVVLERRGDRARPIRRSTQTIEIEAFVDADEIPSSTSRRPYYLAPLAKGEKVYALLREAMAQAGVVGIARVVMHTKEHLAALMPGGPALMLEDAPLGRRDPAARRAEPAAPARRALKDERAEDGRASWSRA